MGGWIKLEKDMVADPRLLRAARTLNEAYLVAHRTAAGGADLSNGDASRFLGNALLGALLTLWCYADEHISDADTLACDASTIDAIVGIDGFCDLIPDDWLVVLDDGTVKLPGYCVKNGLISKKKRRAAANARQRAFKQRQRERYSRAGNAVTDASARVVDQDLDQDYKKKKRNDSKVDFPLVGFDVNAWQRWVEYRKQIGKPIKPASMQAAVDEFAKLGEQQAAIVQQSIANGYQGLFPLKAVNGGKSPPVDESAKRAAQVDDLAKIMRMTRGPNEPRPSFEARVLRANTKRIEALGKPQGAQA